ncbi:hypothetical protein OIDMADRAFT_130744 [Oidiodendron maius Zn]|uniref:NADP-dependent oxidoreductase domain-containing protein n=1 Tax=Oidiodendron maius (strain Zn) TaxID=913774 RepID=A0A0C3GM89_OIDMZ|nr:hypothetical protein OIDMADRAFT_130744 [Oidiodendron maius Zn]
MSHPRPKLIFGTASLGDKFATVKDVNDLLKVLKSHGITTLDTAGLYPSTNMGASERLLGECGAAGDGFAIDTKIFVTSVEASGTLKPEAIEKSISTSIERLQLKQSQKINVLHCHAVDKSTPLEEQARALNEQYKAGRFEQLGVCNYPPDVLIKLIEICERENYIKPTVYQGFYNLVKREAEPLFDILHKHGIVFNAHSPLAGGFLTGRFTAGDIEGTRFDESSHAAPTLKKLFDKKELHDAIFKLTETLQPLNISKTEATLRWICYHSKLGSQDGVILGASKLDQIVMNVESIGKGPLPENVVSIMDGLWKTLAPQ